FLGTQVLGGNGTVHFADHSNLDTYVKGLYVPSANTTLTIDTGVMVHGDTGIIGSSPGGFVTNNGTIAADAGGTITVQGDANFAAGTLTGGTWQASGNSVLQLLGANITTNAATIILDGARSQILSNTTSTSVLANLSANTASGKLALGSNVT